MLETLHISNYALIDRIDIRFAEGLNIITGETGAGKSIMLGALSLLFGSRADTKVVRDPDRKSVIEAQFSFNSYDALKDYCIENDIEWDDHRCILRREIAPAGRSRAFVNDSPVPLSKLEGVAMRLVDIHSQHQNQLLWSPEFQLKVIDTLAGNEARLEAYAIKYKSLRDAMRKLKSAKVRISKTRDDEEFTRFQLEQLEELQLQPGEQEQLEQERDVLSNMTEIKSNLHEALDALSDGPNDALTALADTETACRAIESILPENESIISRLENATIELRDIAETLSALDQKLEADPAELEAIEQRLEAIYSLERKHHVETVEKLIGLREELRQKLFELENSDTEIADLERDARRALALTREAAAEISEARKMWAVKFADELKSLATPLGMKNLQCEVMVEPTDLSATGFDKVEFTFAFNKNQPLMPVRGAASGGEISRLMLSIKTIIADKMELPSIIFDEVDTGVSGDVANRIGEMMRRISGSLQVIAITHLPQVAAKGETHYKVYKEDDETSTHTRICRLSDEQRVGELALMLSGDANSATARANAMSLLNPEKTN